MKTTVIFRKESNGDIVAFFPYDIATHIGDITCYAHIGQHSAASLDYYLSTKPASLLEAWNLFVELTNSVGYDLIIHTRINYRLYVNAYRHLFDLPLISKDNDRSIKTCNLK